MYTVLNREPWTFIPALHNQKEPELFEKVFYITVKDSIIGAKKKISSDLYLPSSKILSLTWFRAFFYVSNDKSNKNP